MLDMTTFHHKTAELLGPPDFGQEVMLAYQELVDELLGEGCRALSALRPDRAASSDHKTWALPFLSVIAAETRLNSAGEGVKFAHGPADCPHNSVDVEDQSRPQALSMF